MKTYKERKEAARNEAINWQMEFERAQLSWGELAIKQSYFLNLATRFGLVREFRENGII